MMPNTSTTRGAGWLIAAAFAVLLASDALAASAGGDSANAGAARRPQAEAGVPSLPDMRLWSFGDCDNRFPYVESAERRECVRVVGSQEAKDARAYRFCATSYGNPDEIARCKAAYDANKARSAQAAAATAAAASQEVPPDIMRQVKAITTAAVEADRKPPEADDKPAEVASPAPVPQLDEHAVPTVDNSSSWSPATVLGFGMGFVLLLGLGAMVARRKQGGSFSRS